MDEAGIRARLDVCLTGADAFTPGQWARLADPFPAWGERQLEHAE